MGLKTKPGSVSMHGIVNSGKRQKRSNEIPLSLQG